MQRGRGIEGEREGGRLDLLPLLNACVPSAFTNGRPSVRPSFPPSPGQWSRTWSGPFCRRGRVREGVRDLRSAQSQLRRERRRGKEEELVVPWAQCNSPHALLTAVSRGGHRRLDDTTTVRPVRKKKEGGARGNCVIAFSPSPLPPRASLSYATPAPAFLHFGEGMCEAELLGALKRIRKS